MQIKTTLGFDVSQGLSLWLVVITQNGLARIIGVVVLT